MTGPTKISEKINNSMPELLLAIRHPHHHRQYYINNTDDDDEDDELPYLSAASSKKNPYTSVKSRPFRFYLYVLLSAYCGKLRLQAIKTKREGSVYIKLS